MKYLALIMLVSSIFAGSANAHGYKECIMGDCPGFVPMYSPSGAFLVPGPHAPRMILPARPTDHIFWMHR